MVKFVLLLLPFVCLAQQPDDHGGAYSHSAASIWGSGNSVIPSPDGKKAIIIRPPRQPESDKTHSVTVKAGHHEYRTEIGAWVNAEAAWSPDSKALFVTYSDGGNVGTYHVKVVYVNQAGIRVIEPIANGRSLLVPNCFELEYPNVGAIKWVGSDSSRLLIAVEVPPHSSCASMGTFGAFEISLPEGKVVSRYGQIVAKKLFGSDIGGALREADDSCVRKPQSCIPTGLNAHNSDAQR
jgi:hypothetical protein